MRVQLPPLAQHYVPAATTCLDLTRRFDLSSHRSSTKLSSHRSSTKTRFHLPSRHPITRQRSRPTRKQCPRAATAEAQRRRQPNIRRQAHKHIIRRCSRPIRPDHAGSFPSGQRGQTVNLMDFSFAGSNPALPTATCAPARACSMWLNATSSIDAGVAQW